MITPAGETLENLLAGPARDPDRIAIAAPDRSSLTYGGLLRHLRGVRDQLREAGVAPADQVAVVLPQGPDLAVAVLAVAVSAACAPLNPAYRRGEYESHLALLRPKAVLVPADGDTPARTAAQGLGIPLLELTASAGDAAGVFTLAGRTAAGPAPADVTGADSIALLLPTSGTTARAKLVPLRHRNLLASARSIVESLALDPADRGLDVMPLYHIHGLMVLIASLAAGASVVCPPPLVARAFFGWLDEQRPTWYSAVPTMHQAILAEAGLHRDVLARAPLRFIRSCSSALPAVVQAELERVFAAPVVNAYGMTEAAHQITTNPLPPGARKTGSVGRPAGVELAIVDARGAPVPTSGTGEVVIRGASVMPGYVDNPDANAAAFCDGWLRTGDEGHLDAEGYLFLTGRLKEMLNRGGAKIAPAEVDEALMAHPGVAQAVAFGVPHPTLGEDVGAAIVLRDGVAVTEDELRAFVAERLAEFKVPRQILFRQEIPKGPSGKLQRLGLATTLGLVASDGGPATARPGIAPRTPTEVSLAAIWRQVLDGDEVTVDRTFFALGGDSLRAVRLFNEIAWAFGRQFPPSTLLQAPTVESLARLIERGEESVSRTALLPLRSEGSKPPLYCVHQHTGQLFCYRDLTRHLTDDRPIYGLVPRGLDGRQTPASRMEEMAAEYVREIRALQPEGPYHVAGFCFGGIVAFEIAQQLRAQGQQVALLALIQASWPGRLPTPLRWMRSLSRRIRFEAHQLTLQPAGHRRRYVMRRAATILQDGWQAMRSRAARAPEADGSPESPIEQAIKRVETAIDDALTSYEPGVYPGRITLFRSPRVPAGFHGDPTMGWKPLAAGGVHIHEIPGDRPNVVDEPDVRILAKKLQACLHGGQRP